MVIIEPFGELNGREVLLAKLENGPLRCELITYGGAIRRLIVPDRYGKPTDVVLGFETLEDYVVNHGCLGALIGPFANRIGLGRFTLHGKTYQLEINNGPNHLHGGPAARFDRKIWSILETGEERVTFGLTHPDGEGNYPGNWEVRVTYTLTEKGLVLDYWAQSDADTLCSLTNHVYFNLDGHDSGPVLNQKVQLFAHSYTPTDSGSIPTGAIRAVSGPMDLTRPTRIGDGVDADLDQLRWAGGYDHNWVLDAGEEPFRPAALAEGAQSGIRLLCKTDRPGIQFYTGNSLAPGMKGKDGAVYGPRCGFCFETQAFPDAPNHASFPSAFLKAGAEWTSRTSFEFR